MNKTKRTLIFVASILELVEIIGLLFTLIVFASINSSALADFVTNITGEVVDVNAFKVAMIIISAIGVAFYSIAAITLLVSIRANGTKFKESRALYITGFVFSILASPLSIVSILLYISLALSNEEPESKTETDLTIMSGENSNNGLIEEIDDLYEDQNKNDSDIKSTFLRYKKLKENNIISDEEYKIMVVKYLRQLRDEKRITQDQFEFLLTKLI